MKRSIPCRIQNSAAILWICPSPAWKPRRSIWFTTRSRKDGEKGFVELTIEDGKIKQKFIQFAKRTLHEINVDITGIETLRSLEKAITDKTDRISPDDLVKINLVGTYTTNTKKDLVRFNQLLENKFFFGRIKDKTTIKINIDDYKYDVSLSGEYVRTVLNSSETEENIGEIITLGLRALRGEDLE